MFQEALESRLTAIEEQITRLLKLAGESEDPSKQDDYLRLAQDLQREARELRSEIKKQSEPMPSTSRESHPKSSFFVLAQ